MAPGPRSRRGGVGAHHHTTSMPPRLRIDGRNILLPSGETALLRGFNLMYMLDSEFSLPRDDTDNAMLRALPLTNVVRLVMIHWDDRPTVSGGKDSRNDCSKTDGSEAISQRCLKQIDTVLRWAASQRLWVVLVVRASIAAGEKVRGVAGATVFDDAGLRKRFMRMWAAVAERYKSFEMIAGYEIMSEPRVDASYRSRVQSFYAEACNVVWAYDNAPCFVGPAPFYDRVNLEHVLLPASGGGPKAADRSRATKAVCAAVSAYAELSATIFRRRDDQRTAAFIRMTTWPP